MKLLDTVKARKLAYYGHNMRKQGESDNARQVHAGEEGHARPGWTTSRHGQESAWKSPPEWQRTEINGESTSTVWPTIGSRTAKEQNGTCPRTEVTQHRGNIPVSVTTSWLAVDVMSRTTRTTLAKSATHSSNDIWTWIHPHTEHHIKKGKGSPYSITERRVLIPVLGSQPAGDVSYKPGGRLPLLSARPAVTRASSFAAWWTMAPWVWTVCLRLLHDSVASAIWTQVLLRLSPAH